MANRSTLAVSKLDDFKEWLKTDGWDIQETKGFWEVLRATKKGRKRPIIIYKRIDTNSGTELVHYTVEDRDMGVVRAFLKDSLKSCQNEFKVGGRYIYSFDNSAGHTEALVEIVRKTNRAAIIKFIEVYEEHTGNDYFSYLLKVGGTMGASYERLKEESNGN